MQVEDYNKLEWDKIISDNDNIIVSYESSIDCPVCDEMVGVFQRLSGNERYGKIRFLRIDSKSNAIAEEYIRKKKLPFVAAFKRGILLECNSIRSETQFIEILERLLKYKVKF